MNNRLGLPCSSCGCPIDGAHKSYCRYCDNFYRKQRRKNKPTEAVKLAAKNKAHQYLKAGIIQRAPCVFCGNPEAEMHHGDYSKPTDISWLCRKCHTDFHVLERKVLKCA